MQQPSAESSTLTSSAINHMDQPLINYVLHLADNALILAQRNAEWTGHGPILEQDIAISNIALDLIGQARNFYQYAAALINANEPAAKTPATEDSLAYLRHERDFRNCLLVELERGDWAVTTLRQFFFSNYQVLLFRQMQSLPDSSLAGIAEKSLKEAVYHLRWSAEWVIRLGDGTVESRHRMKQAMDRLWPFTGELLWNASYENTLTAANAAVDLHSIASGWMEKTTDTLAQAGLELPANGWMQSGGKEGRHTEHLGYILAELQYLQRSYPGNEW